MLIWMSPKENIRTQDMEMYPRATYAVNLYIWLLHQQSHCKLLHHQLCISNLPRHNYLKYWAASNACSVWASGSHMAKDIIQRRLPFCGLLKPVYLAINTPEIMQITHLPSLVCVWRYFRLTVGMPRGFSHRFSKSIQSSLTDKMEINK